MCGFTDSPTRETRALPVETLLKGRYIIGRLLGVGGFGITYVAYDLKRNLRVAIKEYFPMEWSRRVERSTKIISTDERYDEYYSHGLDVFIGEAHILGKLKRVPNIVNVRGLFKENNTAYMVMELLEGYTLNSYLMSVRTKAMSYTEANKIIYPISVALNRVHNEMLLHRDVSPDNMMMTADGNVYLIDFGATRMYGLNSPNSMSVLVKGGFAPFEQYSRNGHQGPWTDVYALAATYYYLVTGKKPPDAPDRITGKRLVPLKELVPGIPEEINKAILHALEKDWNKRPQNMTEFIREMHLGEIPTTNWQVPASAGETSRIGTRPCVLMQIGKQRTRYYLKNNSISIGRGVPNREGNVKLENDNHISSNHCKVDYDPGSGKFVVTDYSKNRTYTSRGILNPNEQARLDKGEWLYIQTLKARYIFYLEVE